MSKGIPDKITIDGKEIVVKDNKELLELIESVRKSEKDKLYSQISGLESKVKVLEDEKGENGKLSATKEAELKKLQDELAVAKADHEKASKELNEVKAAKKGAGKEEEDEEDDTKGKGKNKKEPVEKGLTMEQVRQLLKEEREEMKKELEAQIGTVTGKLTKAQVEQYRKEQIAKYSDVIIEDFVAENLDSQEAVNKAIETALEKSKKYIRKEYEVDGTKKELTLAEIEKLEKEAQESKKTPTYNPDGGTKPPAKPEGGSGNLSGKELLSQLGEMSDEEYEKHRDQIMREAKQEKYVGAQQ